MDRYGKKVRILRQTKVYGHVDSGFVGMVQGIIEWAEEHGESNDYIAEEVKMALRAYKEVIGE